ncbi:MAG: hypothetical protein A2V70_16005 [Planctomycetes bacterium RBG_13_63_9]|nr:MAG: hypothetical protein A2V70_16005 [Planctomycetes bacterium RBG_13_63_9]
MRRLAAFVTAVVGIAVAVPEVATSDVVIDQDTTIDYSEDSLVRVIDGVDPPTRVDVVAGGTLRYLQAEDSSVVSVDGGLVSNSSLDTPGITALGSSTVNVSLGGVDCEEHGIHAFDTSTVNVTGGTVEVIEHIAIVAFGHSEVNVTGGLIRSRDSQGIAARDFSIVNVSGGIFDTDNESVLAEDSSTVSISAGEFNQLVGASGTSVLNVTGGTIGSLEPSGQGIYAEGSAMVNVSGGSLRGELIAAGSSTLTIIGYDLDLTDEWLTGRLADGTPLAHQAVTIDGGQFVLQNVPEPSVIVLALTGILAAGLTWRRRRP